jgi:hypothetical protein
MPESDRNSEGVQDPHEDFLQLVATAPKVSLDDPRVQAWLEAQREGDEEAREPEHDQFGNNFHLLFQGSRLRENDPNNTVAQIYLGRAEEEYGEIWVDFISTNEDLMRSLDELLFDNPYDQLFGYIHNLYRAREYDKVDELNKASDHPLGCEAIGIAVWDKINPLLERAAAEMEASGIDARQFFG